MFLKYNINTILNTNTILKIINNRGLCQTVGQKSWYKPNREFGVSLQPYYFHIKIKLELLYNHNIYLMICYKSDDNYNKYVPTGRQ